MKTPLLSASDLTIGYHHQGTHAHKRVQEHLEFTLDRGALTCLLGPNGAGKSTLLRTLGGMQAPLEGSLLLEGKALNDYSEQEKSRTIGLVLTDKTHAGGLRVEELVALGRHPHVGFFGRLQKQDHIRVEQAMEQVGIAHKADSYISQLSDGERQKVMIAKALAQECPLIVLDEPTAFLDVVSRIEIMHLLHQLTEQGKTILLSTHDIEQALSLADQLWLLSKENGLVRGTTEDLVLRGELDRFFSRGGVAFDPLRGSFRMESTGLETVVVAANETNFCWTQNALLRNGFRTVSPTKNAASPATKDSLHLEVLSPSHLVARRAGDEEQIFASFSQLIEYLKTQHHRG